MGRPIINVIGMKFGKLTVISEYGRNKKGQVKWLCSCECGGSTIDVLSNLRNSVNPGCGCRRKEISKDRASQPMFAENKLFNNRKIDANGCWYWTGLKDRDDYGIVSINKKAWRVHRFSYTYWVGDIPFGMIVCHICDRPSCFNPDHLFLGSIKDNNNDRDTKGRGAKPKGSLNARAILNEEQVLEIKAWLSVGVSCAQLSRFFRVSRPTIQYIKSGKTWKHV